MAASLPPKVYNGNEIPGPGTYSQVIDHHGYTPIGDAPKYSMGARKVAYKADGNSPGPIYSPQVITPTAHGPVGDAPQYSFGNSKRHAATVVGGDPGPGQYAQICMRDGTGLLGTSTPKYGFGSSAQREPNVSPRHTRSSTGPRFVSKEHASKANYGIHSPGPLKYQLNDGLGTYFSGTDATPNSARYTMRPRLENYQPPGAPKGGQPGPGTYNALGAFGNQQHSARATAASFGFGTSERHRPELQPKKTMYVGKDFERQNLGVNSPGPCKYAIKQTLGPGAAVGMVKVTPSWSFGGEDRFAY
eukprot:CAMPEP_0181205778 /NCGR_PEP_ID=MMETSP1096-20121128/20661_1 /TAXON_ID=156174 ORGANISM="Chrysochromulina ericina, Strain CCMP281" /NCGR_SAMPLE_ID=MMETSP1096 /ASSEMBLY_ACC=CAM_ASM_000453 /LENGTH=302 /DNA_ID=CAMNT_0023296589 /DNA_START=25 /DNA_END=933 /DNA_ORIENTATION=-